GEPPRAPEPGREPERSRGRAGDQEALDAEGDGLVAEPAQGALVREPVAAAPPEAEGAGWERREPERERDGNGDEHTCPDATPADPLERIGERARLPDDEREDGELRGDGREQEDAAHPPVVPLPPQVVGAEVVARIEARDRERRHRRPPE